MSTKTVTDTTRRPPGQVRDAIIEVLRAARKPLAISEIQKKVDARLGKVSSSSVRSYMQVGEDRYFERVSRGRYRLKS